MTELLDRPQIEIEAVSSASPEKRPLVAAAIRISDERALQIARAANFYFTKALEHETELSKLRNQMDEAPATGDDALVLKRDINQNDMLRRSYEARFQDRLEDISELMTIPPQPDYFE